MAKILVVDDEELIRWSLAEDLAAAGYKTVSAEGVAEALRLVEKESPDVVLTDLRLGAESGLDLLKAVHRDHPGVAVILMTGFADLSSAVSALREGAADYIAKPLQLAGLKITLERVLETVTLRTRLKEAHRKRRGKYNFDSIVAASPSMREALATARKVAASPQGNILLLGESGCGKDRLARAIHYESSRREAPLVEISCTAIPEHLLESEFFGYEKGAFTGAAQQKKGLFESAHGGTVFLNEIGHMSGGLQAKILRVLEDKVFKRVGGVEDVTVDVRVIAATNEDLPRAVAEGRFRQDLYYRINVLVISLLPLRERPEDVLPLVERLLGVLSLDLRKPKPVLSPKILEQFKTYKWPGNVRELRNVLERMMILDELEFHPAAAPPAAATPAKKEEGSAVILPPDGLKLEDVEKDLVLQALKRSGGNQQKAAQSLGLSRDALRRRIDKFGLKEGLGALMLLIFLTAGASAADWFGKKDKVKGDPFAAYHAVKAAEFKAAPGAHAPVKEGACSKCHADTREPAVMVLKGKEMCLSCHANRVEDLKKPVVHPPFKDMDCNTCHQPHASSNEHLLNSPVNKLCAACHDPKEDPAKTAHQGISVIEGQCTDCHSPHASKNAKLIIEGKEHVPFASRSCEMCHEKTKADGKAALKEIPQATCFVCHSNFRKLDKSPVVHVPFASGDCTTCHNPHASKRGSLIRKPLADICFSCHDEALKNNHPSAGHKTANESKADPRRAGKPFNCASCHEPHAGALPSLTRAEPMILCMECHKQ